MGNEKFNLIDENWIKVIDDKYRLREVSIREFFRNAHTYSEFCGETVSQDFAVMRMLLAILHTAVERYDIEGNEHDFFDQDPVDVWMSIWSEGKFSEKQIGRYLDEWHERFYLFHDKYPFYQVPEMPFPKTKTKPKMIRQMDVEVSESNNKPRMFSGKSEAEKQFLRYPEVARSLVHYQNFSDCSQKCQNGRTADSAGNQLGWCGRISPVFAVGRNLFETLMLNLMLEVPAAEQHENRPVWERDIPDNREDISISFPDNLAELYTMQSRRIKLLDAGDDVRYFYTTYGEIPSVDDAVGREPMTFFSVNKKGNLCVRRVTKDNKNVQSWRNFPFAINYIDDGAKKIVRKRPLIADWLHKLVNYTDTIPIVFFRTVSVSYGKVDGCINDICQDEIVFSSGLFNDGEEVKLVQVMKEINLIDKVAYRIKLYVNDLAAAEGTLSDEGTANPKLLNDIIADYYREINEPFLYFLRHFNGEEDEIDNWHRETRDIVLDRAKFMAKSCSRAAYIGRYTDKDEKKAEIMTAPLALLRFQCDIARLYGKQ